MSPSGTATRTASSTSPSCQTPAHLASFQLGPAGSHGSAHLPPSLHHQFHASWSQGPLILRCHLTLSVWCGSVHFQLVLYPGSAQDPVLDPHGLAHTPQPLRPHLGLRDVFCLSSKRVKNPRIGRRYSQSQRSFLLYQEKAKQPAIEL